MEDNSTTFICQCEVMFDNKSTVLVHDNDSMSIHSLIALIRIFKNHDACSCLSRSCFFLLASNS